MRRHILAADCVIITLGLTEVFFQQHNGHAICAAPGYSGGGGIGCEFRATEYPENFANIERVDRNSARSKSQGASHSDRFARAAGRNLVGRRSCDREHRKQKHSPRRRRGARAAITTTCITFTATNW